MNSDQSQHHHNTTCPEDTSLKIVSTQKRCTWTNEEEQSLLSIYRTYKENTDDCVSGVDFDDDEIWERVASAMPSRSAVQCLLRYMKLTAPNQVSDIDCSAPIAAADGKRGHNDGQSPSSESTGSGSSRKKIKTTGDSADDWTEEESKRLTEVMLQYQDGSTTPDWDAIAKNIPGKSPIDCLTHWTYISLPDQVKGKGSWLPNEDAILKEKRHLYGRKWSKIAEYLPGRSGKQCRERYINHLNPNLKRGEWTDDEEAVLIGMHEHHGNKWALISKQLPGRSDNDVKNHFHSTINRKFDIHGREKLVKAAIEHVFMLVNAGRLERHVVEDWKPTSASAPAHPVIPEAIAHPPVEPYPAIAPDHAAATVAAGGLMYSMYDPLHYRHPFPSHPPVGVLFPPMFHGHPPPRIDSKGMMPPDFTYHPEETNKKAP